MKHIHIHGTKWIRMKTVYDLAACIIPMLEDK